MTDNILNNINTIEREINELRKINILLDALSNKTITAIQFEDLEELQTTELIQIEPINPDKINHYLNSFKLYLNARKNILMGKFKDWK